MSRHTPSSTHSRWECTYVLEGEHGRITVTAASKADAIAEVWAQRPGCGIATVHALSQPAPAPKPHRMSKRKTHPAPAAAQPPHPVPDELDTPQPVPEGHQRRRRG